MDLKVLRDIAEYIEMNNIVHLLDDISGRLQQKNTNLIFPLVGEFSSGKTTLINALTDSKKLETATKPTTATIYKLHFGCEHCYAKVLNMDGSVIEYQNISEIKNDKIEDAVLVDVFDTSKMVPSTTILVDTPGLSSPDRRHKQALVNFLPKADGILLVTDVNQQLTRSLIEFVRTITLSKRPVFLVLTKCDTKSDKDLESIKKYICNNIQIPIQQIVCVSAIKGEVHGLLTLLDKIQNEKSSIIRQVDNERIKNIINILLQRIDELLKSLVSDKELKNSIRQQEIDLKHLYNNIDRLVNDVSCDVEEIGVKFIRQFEDVISNKLEALVVGKSNNFDNEAISVINNTASLLLNEYKNDIQALFRKKAKERKGKDIAVSLQSLENIDLSSLNIQGLNYDINLNVLGHQYDSAISIATKIAVAAGTVYAGATILGANVASTVATAATADNLIDVADTATDVMSMQSNNKMAKRIESAVNFVGKTTEKVSSIDDYSKMAGQQIGESKGIVESMVGFITDKTMGKPQRKRAIHNYIDGTLLPDFKSEMKKINSQVISSINVILHEEAQETINQKKTVLEQMQKEYTEKKSEYEQRVSKLHDYRNLLIKF